MVLKILIYRLYRGVFYMEFELPGYCSTLTLGGFVFNFTRKKWLFELSSKDQG